MNLVLLALALILLSAGVLVLGRGESTQKRRDAVARLDAAMTHSVDPLKLEKDPLKKKYVPQWVTDNLISAGLPVDQKMALQMALFLTLPPLLTAIWKGLPNALGVFLLCVMALVAWIAAKQRKRRSQMMAQLPAFLDNLVRVSSVGYSITVSFNTAVESAEQPLKDALNVAVQMQFAGLELDEAMHRLARIYKLIEFKLIASVVNLALNYGGKSDILLGRLGQYLRDRESHHKEMMAMSAEARTSAVFMSALTPILVSVILILNPNYLSSMWFDPTGRMVLFVGAGLQLLGVVLIYRLVRSI